MDIPTYTDLEYQQYLRAEGWTKEETDHLMDLAQRFDLRFIVMADRYDTEKFSTKRSVEDLKDRYYKICGILAKVCFFFLIDFLNLTFFSNKIKGEKKIYTYDADHERRRKEQLKRLHERTHEQVRRIFLKILYYHFFTITISSIYS